MRPGMEWVVLLLIVVVVFGWKQLPNIARSMGRSARVLRSEVDEMKAESRESKTRQATVPGDVVTDPVRDPARPEDSRPLGASAPTFGAPLTHMSDAELEAELRRRAGQSARTASDTDLEAELRRRAERREP